MGQNISTQLIAIATGIGVLIFKQRVGPIAVVLICLIAAGAINVEMG